MLNITDGDLQIQSDKSEVQLKMKLHQLWRMHCDSVDSSLFFSKENVSLLTGTRISFLCYWFSISLTCSVWTVLLSLCQLHFVIMQDHGFGSPSEPHQLPD